MEQKFYSVNKEFRSMRGKGITMVSLDDQIEDLFEKLSRDEKEQLLTLFECALKSKSLCASDHHQQMPEAL